MHIAWAFKIVITKNMWMLAQNWINLTCDFTKRMPSLVAILSTFSNAKFSE